ncbi:hypothetical protein SAMN04489724_3551 [Algoriphagus locisalis]|uniref:PIN domain-containing protein n=1 Tax=Algoriphagus locisalis TaxID=305507 RepID=A0A1I7CXL8_9BACT|nr:putative toxin-antitoxin system toxin component, PIN family [Algoriphagus locisalis]SFU04149.1 hypothetical protein SAMN04489724_3551 [Algoriphagus locisalis]
MKDREIKVIFDTNVWISFLIGKSLSKLKHLISNGVVKIVTTDQLLLEIKKVSQREKLKKYFPPDSVNDLIDLLESIAVKVEISPTHFVSRDPKDNFLLDLIDYAKADFLVTGDKDLLELNPFKTAQIVTPSTFASVLERY